ncbi:MAG: hypothetical protein QOH67_2652 [Hyphomicrobiales bacterium]|nr:hypothetical protein [Hyphomicrobiales bacterium]
MRQSGDRWRCRLPLEFSKWQSGRLAIPKTADIGVLTAADFEPRLHDEFSLRGANGEIALQLSEVRKLGQARRAGGAFSLLFLSAPGPVLPQAIYPLTHPGLGTVELFLVPIGRVDGRNGYEAVFT